MAAPPAASGQSLTIRNDTTAPLVLQVAAVVRGVLQRGRPALLAPGDTTPAITIPGNKILTIYDAKAPNRVLFQGVIPGSKKSLDLGIVPDYPPPRVRLKPRSGS
jgi:hypothetical protein